MSKICPRCGTSLPDDAVFCFGCGARQNENQGFSFCPYCGSHVDSGAAFCMSCGKALAPAAQPAAPEPPVPPVSYVQPLSPANDTYYDMQDDAPTELLSGKSPYYTPEPTPPVPPADSAYYNAQDDAPTELLSGKSPYYTPEPTPPVPPADSAYYNAQDDAQTELLSGKSPYYYPQDDAPTELLSKSPYYYPEDDAPTELLSKSLYYKEEPDYSDVPAQQPQTPAPQPQKPKKKKTGLIIGIAVGAAVLAILAAVFFIFILPMFHKGEAGSSSIIYETKGNVYYASPYLMSMKGDTLKQVFCTDGEGGEKYAYANCLYSVQVGDTIYGLNGDIVPNYQALTKTKPITDDRAEVTPWITTPDAESVFTPSSASIGATEWVRAMRNFGTDGKFVYFNLIPDMEHLAYWGDITGMVGRISLDGNQIEQVGDINAADLVVDGSWIYYFDAGYNPPRAGSSAGTIDASRVGFYKIKTDGFGKQLLRSAVLKEGQDRFQFTVSSSPCGDLKLIGGKLYFIDYSEGGEGRLARMDTDGGGFEYVTAQAVRYYAVDTDSNAVFYFVGSSDDWGVSSDMSSNLVELYKCDLRTKLETKIPFVKQDMSRCDYYDGYLYFTYYGFRYESNQSAHVGLRMNTKTNKLEWVSGYRNSESGWTTDPDTGRQTHYANTDEPQPKWVSVEQDELNP